MTHFYRRLLLLTLLFISALSPLSSAQGPDTGMPRFGSFANFGPGTLNLANLNNHLGFSIFTKGGRGMPFNFNLSHDTSIWYPADVSGNNVWQPVPNWGWRGPTGAFTGQISVTTTSALCWNPQTHLQEWYTRYDFTGYRDSLGTMHPVTGAYSIARNNCFSQPPVSGTASDGSGYTIVPSDDGSSQAQVLSASGTVISNQPSGVGMGSATIIDPNGNMISAANGVFADTTGTTVLTVTGGTPNPLVFTYSTLTGASPGTPGTSTVTVSYKQYTMQTNFGCNNIQEYGPAADYLVDTIQYDADGSSYQFSYEPTPGISGAVTGRLASVKLRTGATISYSYTGSNNGIVCADGSTAGLDLTTLDGKWHYSRGGSGTQWTTTVVDPQSNNTVYNFSGNFETSHKIYAGQASGNPFLTILTCYNGETNCDTAVVFAPITQKKVITQWPNMSASAIQTVYDPTYGLVTETDTYDSDYHGLGPLKNKTVIQYASLGNNIVDRPSSVTVYDGSGTTMVAQTTFGYDETAVVATSGVPQHTAVTGSRGNATTVKRWLNTTGGTLNSTSVYDDTGKVVSATDAGGHTTTFGYSCANAYLSQVTMPDTPFNPSHHTTSSTYDCANTGLVTSTKDQNGNRTNYFYDAMLRPTAIVYPDTDLAGNQGETDFFYPDTNTVETKQRQDASTWLDQFSYTDGYGRPKSTIFKDFAEGDVSSETTYDAVGRVATVSNPHRAAVPSGTTDGTTSDAYDPLGRVTTVTHPDGNQVNLTYGVGNLRCTDVKDETGRQEPIYCTTGLGQPALTAELVAGVWNETDYQYDALGNLTEIDQIGPYGSTSGTRKRTFRYDSISRLLEESNPESGDICYGTRDGSGNCLANGYDADGNLLYKTDARGILTTMTYDPLHRILSQTSSDPNTPDEAYGYDHLTPTDVPNSVGRLAFHRRGSLWHIYAGYDAMGRLLGDDACGPSGCIPYTPENWWSVRATYDLAGHQTSLTYPSGHTVKQEYDGAGRLSSVDGYYGVSAHWPNGVPSNMNLGNGVKESLGLNNRLQATDLAAQGNQNQNVLSRSMQYYDASKHNNGNVLSITDKLNGGHSQQFGYDGFNRLSSVSQTDGALKESYNYDVWGNATQLGSFQQAYDQNNRLVRWSYDAAGNLLNDGNHSYTYDGFGMMTTVDVGAGGATARYTYGAQGERVRKDVGSAWTEYAQFGGQVIAEKDQTGAWTDYIFADGQRIAKTSAAGTFYYHRDHLGSTQAMTDAGGNVVSSCNYAPFGRQLGCSTIDPFNFTGYEHDAESGLDHAWFRQYASTMGRFTSPDPYDGSMDLANPQSLNRYAYVTNNPMSYTDPFGLYAGADPTIPEILPNPDPPSGGGGGRSCSVDGMDVPCSIARGIAGLDEFDLLNLASTPTAIGYGWTQRGDSSTFGLSLIYGNIGLLDFLLDRGTPLAAGTHLAPGKCVNVTDKTGAYMGKVCGGPHGSSHVVMPDPVALTPSVAPAPITHEQKCENITKIGYGLEGTAALNEAGAFLTLEASPPALIFHGIAIGESLGGAGVLIYSHVFCPL